MDIEDLGREEVVAREERKGTVVPKRFKRARRLREESGPGQAPSGVPGTQSVYIKTWGCSHNGSDGEFMAGQLASYGYALTQDRDAADLWLLNSCTVKAPSQDVFINAVRDGKRRNKALVLCGCVPQGEPRRAEFEGASLLGVNQIDRVVEVVEETLRGNNVRLLDQKKRPGAAGSLPQGTLNLPKIRRNPLVEIISINSGCLNQCTYCKTKHARGDLRSYPPSEIVQRARLAVSEGVREIWLTSEDTGTYGRDIGYSLPRLMRDLIREIPDGVMLKLGMSNPPYFLEYLPEMAEILRHPRVYSVLHVPVQAGSDAVLARMRRKYTQADFRRVVDYLTKNVPGMSIHTDVICGFPGETAQDWEQTMALIAEYKFPAVHISQFYPRPGTPAARMKRIDTKTVKARSKQLTDLFLSYDVLSDRKGRVYRVLATELAKDKKHYVAHNKSYDQVLVPADPALLGKTFDVRIVKTGKFHLIGEILRPSLEAAPVLPRPLPRGVASGTADEWAEPQRLVQKDTQRSNDSGSKVISSQKTLVVKASGSARRTIAKVLVLGAIVALMAALIARVTAKWPR